MDGCGFGGYDTLLLPKLKAIQKKNGYISEPEIKKLSIETKIPISKIYGVATFYAMLHTEKQGSNVIYLCTSPSCYVNGAIDLMKFIREELNLKIGESNKKFSFYATACIGCCDEAPAMLLNGKVYGNLTKEKVKSILKKCKS